MLELRAEKRRVIQENRNKRGTYKYTSPTTLDLFKKEQACAPHHSQARDVLVYLDRVTKLWGWRAAEDEQWRILYNIWAFVWNMLLLVLLPLSMSMEYVQRFKTSRRESFFSSLEICVDMQPRHCWMAWTCAAPATRNAPVCTATWLRRTGARCYVAYHILYSGFVVINWTGYLLLGRHAWRMYLPGLDSERNFLVTSFFELLLMTVVVTMNLARCHMGLLKDRFTKLLSDPSKSEEEHQEDLNRYIQDHSEILEYVHLLRPVYSSTIFVQFLLIGLVLGLSMIHIMFFSNFWTGIGTMCFMSNWMAASRRYKSTLVYFLHNLQQPIVLTAGGIFPICMQTNLSMAKMAFSVVTIIKQFNLADKFQ